MYNWKLYKVGVMLGIQYHFPNPGDGIPMHAHGEEDKHNVIVLRGSCEIYGPNKAWSYIVHAGAVFHFADHEHLHEIAALEKDTLIFNQYIYGDKFIHLRLDFGNHDDMGADMRPLTIPLVIPKKQKVKK